MAVPFDTIGRGLLTLLEILVASLTPMFLIALGLRFAVGVLAYLGRSISKAFEEPPPALTRVQFEEKYGPFRSEDLQAAHDLRMRQRPFMKAVLSLTAVWMVALIVALVFGVTWKSSQLMAIAMLLWGVSYIILFVGLAFIKERHFGSDIKAFKSHILSSYKVAPEDRITYKTLRPLVDKKS